MQHIAATSKARAGLRNSHAPIATARRNLLAAGAVLPFAGVHRAAAARDVPRTINSVDTIVDDMRLMNDLPLRCHEDRTVGWYVGPGYNQSAGRTRAAASPRPSFALIRLRSTDPLPRGRPDPARLT